MSLSGASEIERAASILRQGGLVAFPTETVYGLGADATSETALQTLYAVKGRPRNHPVIVHIKHQGDLSRWARDIPEPAWQLADAFWPGPMTLILLRSESVLDAVTGGQDTIGLRVPAHPVALDLLKAFGGGIAAPSANRFGRLSPTSAVHVQADLGSDVGMILDGGDCPVGVESTIVAFREGRPMILRPGMITPAQIDEVLRLGFFVDEAEGTIRVPGALKSHYAPSTSLHIIPPGRLETEVSALIETDQKVGVLAHQDRPVLFSNPDNPVWLQLPTLAGDYARGMYGMLRRLDGMGLDAILVQAVPDSLEWAAIADRLHRAAVPPD